jgi:hypothetical protein
LPGTNTIAYFAAFISYEEKSVVNTASAWELRRHYCMLSLSLILSLSLSLPLSWVEVPRSKQALSIALDNLFSREREREREGGGGRQCAFYLYSIALLGVVANKLFFCSSLTLKTNKLQRLYLAWLFQASLIFLGNYKKPTHKVAPLYVALFRSYTQISN